MATITYDDIREDDTEHDKYCKRVAILNDKLFRGETIWRDEIDKVKNHEFYEYSYNSHDIILQAQKVAR